MYHSDILYLCINPFFVVSFYLYICVALYMYISIHLLLFMQHWIVLLILNSFQKFSNIKQFYVCIHPILLNNSDRMLLYSIYVSLHYSILWAGVAVGAASQCFWDELMLLKCELMLLKSKNNILRYWSQVSCPTLNKTQWNNVRSPLLLMIQQAGSKWILIWLQSFYIRIQTYNKICTIPVLGTGN